jgi:hypothetical protein
LLSCLWSGSEFMSWWFWFRRLASIFPSRIFHRAQTCPSSFFSHWFLLQISVSVFFYCSARRWVFSPSQIFDLFPHGDLSLISVFLLWTPCADLFFFLAVSSERYSGFVCRAWFLKPLLGDKLLLSGRSVCRAHRFPATFVSRTPGSVRDFLPGPLVAPRFCFIFPRCGAVDLPPLLQAVLFKSVYSWATQSKSSSFFVPIIFSRWFTEHELFDEMTKRIWTELWSDFHR